VRHRRCSETSEIDWQFMRARKVELKILATILLAALGLIGYGRILIPAPNTLVSQETLLLAVYAVVL